MDLKQKLEYLLENYKQIPNELFLKYEGYYDDDKYSSVCVLYDKYESDGGYEGSGERIGIRKSDGKLLYGYDSHCSCNTMYIDGPNDAYGEFVDKFFNNYKHEKDQDKYNVGTTTKFLEMETDIILDNWGEEAEKSISLVYDIVKGNRPIEDYKKEGIVKYDY